jgi:predicted O-methyltransferase YrrM
MRDFRLPSLIAAMADRPELWTMGHNQDQQHLDLGLGWFYYGLTRSLRPSRVVVIGSWRGFAPMLMAQALQDAGSGAELIFIDPSFVDAQWRSGVDEYFAGFGIHCIRHFCETSQEFLAANRLEPGSVDLFFVDGYHTEEQCRLEYDGFGPLLSERAVTLFHDSTSHYVSGIYGDGNEYEHTVWRYIDALRARPDLEVVNLEIAQGVAMVKRRLA